MRGLGVILRGLHRLVNARLLVGANERGGNFGGMLFGWLSMIRCKSTA